MSTKCNKPSCKHAREQYAKIQDFIISNRLWRGYHIGMTHADILIDLYKEVKNKTTNQYQRS